MLLLLLALQQGPGPAPVQATTPPSRDTIGYWQQRADYRIAARLDERAQRLEARGTLAYTNHSPDTLRELYLHQYLNAFRPASLWSRQDAREGRVRFQNLKDPDHGYERFTADPLVDGVAVKAEYPGAPDSTVVRLALPRPLPPGGTVRVEMAWHARPATLPRRQGRRGRSWDFAHWYPKVAVYDRGGWEMNALQPAGEFYAEFGDFEVDLTLANDQVVGTTGVVVAGDPGWERVRRWGQPRMQPAAYDVALEAPATFAPEENERTVRIRARDVHTFAWSTSPDYRYEGGAYVRPSPRPMRFRTWDTVAVHVLYRPGDEGQWGNGQAVQRTVNAIAWLERTYGPYAYPQMTNLHRLDGGGTEYPMMMMNGSASQGLILHEGGHIFTYGILANNEWRSGWMDEGLTSYQTSWAQGLTRIEEARGGAGVALPVRLPAPVKPKGYAGLALRPTDGPDADLGQWRAAATGTAEPIGTRADRFRDFGTYNAMIYDRAEMMYGQLRDAIGDSAFSAFLQDYYARWALRHVDEVAMRASAERAAGRDLGWFFDQWVHRTGLIDYALVNTRTRRDGDAWVTRARVVRRGTYRHPMPVGVRTASGWTIARAEPTQDKQWVEVRTTEEPQEVRLDPHRTTEDWYRPNDERVGWWIFKGPRGPRNVVDWPLLDQSSADRSVAAWSPMAWYHRDPGLALGVRVRGNYRGIVDRNEVGFATYTENTVRLERCRNFGLTCPGNGGDAQTHVWAILENPYANGGRVPRMGYRAAYAEIDGIQFAELRQRFDRRRFVTAPSARFTTDVAVRFTRPYARGYLDDGRWSGVDVLDGRVAMTLVPAARPLPVRGGQWRPTARVELLGGVRGESLAEPGLSSTAFGVLQAEASTVRRTAADRWTTFARAWYTYANDDAPVERLPSVGTRGATELFFNHLVRPAGGALSHEDVPFVVPGGAALRGYAPYGALRQAVAFNGEQARKLHAFGRTRRLGLWATGWANIAARDLRFEDRLAEAGAGLALRGPLFDRDVRFRVDLPLWLSEPALAIGGRGTSEEFGVRVSFAASDLF